MFWMEDMKPWSRTEAAEATLLPCPPNSPICQAGGAISSGCADKTRLWFFSSTTGGFWTAFQALCTPLTIQRPEMEISEAVSWRSSGYDKTGSGLRQETNA